MFSSVFVSVFVVIVFVGHMEVEVEVVAIRWWVFADAFVSV
jgi:hypothetical protein